jgi:anion-transporting  ArsA/GET3 family ATPase
MAVPLSIVTGKGGVGKTTVAAALGLRFARQGLRTLVAEVHGRGRLAALFGGVYGNPDNLRIVDLNPHEAMREYAQKTLRFETLVKLLFDNVAMQQFLRLIPSLGELTMLGKIWFHAQEAAFDRIVLDAPATGHALAMLRAPKALSVLVPAGPLHDNACGIAEMLARPSTKIHIVTTAEEMAVTEANEIYQTAKADFHLGTAFINRCLTLLPEDLEPLLHRQEKSFECLRRRLHKQAEAQEHLSQLPDVILNSAVFLPYDFTSPVVKLAELVHD